MMRVFWDEWRGARDSVLKTILPLLVAVAALLLGWTGLQPAVATEALATGLVVAATRSGTQRWNRVPSWDWVGIEGVGAAAYAAGKTSGFLMLAAFWTLVLSPGVLLSTVLWGVPVPVVMAGLAWALVGGVLAQALSHVAAGLPSQYPQLIGTALVTAAVGASFIIPEFRGFNPGWRIWDLYRTANSDLGLGALVLVAGVAALLWVPSLLLLNRQRPRP